MLRMKKHVGLLEKSLLRFRALPSLNILECIPELLMHEMNELHVFTTPLAKFRHRPGKQRLPNHVGVLFLLLGVQDP
ncbi:Uncharacterised protein [Actinobacillus pleuropneumoniae]|nr:Uncharacterised protein [Actinobacillus pleuropneumoniae]